MAESNEEQAHLREMWPNEALDFTPWLFDNLDKLGRAVGLSLEPVQQEQQIGSFSLDILARETNENVMVAIENQLEWTDHSHLGQLLTYAAGCDASIAIWVAARLPVRTRGSSAQTKPMGWLEHKVLRGQSRGLPQRRHQLPQASVA